MKTPRCFPVLSLALALALITAPGASLPAQAGKAKSAPAASLEAIAEADFNYARARHLLLRAGFGGTAEEVEALHAMGLDQAVQYFVDYQAAGKFNCPLEIGPRPQPQYPKGVKRDSDEGRAIRQKAQRAERDQYKDLQAWWVKRMIESPRPLEEKLTLFWHGLLVSGYRTVRDSKAMYQQNQLYRKHAAGSYGDLLHGIIHDPAMLRYLDNNSNVRGRPNENLAREIMELFSMGEGQGYTETDIKEAARALTGNVYDREANFIFREKSHDPGEKTIFGQTGTFKGDDLVELILEQPATARYVSNKLFEFFAYENPDEAIVDALAAKLRGCNYELKPALKTLFKSKAFYSDQAVGHQVKSPVQLVIGTVRTLGIEADHYEPLVGIMSSMEQELFQPPNVKGWDGGKAWMNTSTVFNRYNFAGLVETRLRPKYDKKRKKIVPGGQTAASLLADKGFKNSTEVVDYLIKTFLAVEPTPEKRARLIAYLDEGSPLPPTAEWKGKPSSRDDWKKKALINDKLVSVIVLMMSMPEYQVT